jgi:hypothetical protein
VAERSHHLGELGYPLLEGIDALRGYDWHPAMGFPVAAHYRLAAFP